MLGTKSYYAQPIAAVLAPITVVNVEAFTTVVDMSRYHEVKALLLFGDIANEEVVFRCVACDDDGDNPTATLEGKTLTIAAATLANDGTQNAIVVSAQDLFVTQPTKRYIKFGVVTDNTTGGPMAIVVIGTPRYYVGASTTDSFGEAVV